MTSKEREEAITTIKRLERDFGDYEPNHKVFENILSALKGGWIPVKVALPEEGRSVLVCFKSQGGMAQAVSERFNVSGEWIWSALGGRKPLAWQPLPEPYKKGE